MGYTSSYAQDEMGKALSPKPVVANKVKTKVSKSSTASTTQSRDRRSSSKVANLFKK